jgi:DNA-binding transcriptional LysR family regulator
MHVTAKISATDMLLFVDVVREASFTAAARRQGVSKQAVSERINRLEAALGVRLLQRTTRRLRTTEAGERYYVECAAIAQHIEQANLAVQTEQAEPVGLLRVSAPILYGRAKLVNAIKTYTQRYPKVRVDLRLADRLVNLVDEGVDVALRVSGMNDGNLSVRRLGSVSAYFVASPSFVKAQGAQSDVQILSTAPAITVREGEIWDLPTGAKVKPNAVLTVNDLASVAAAAAQGIGLARLPGILCKPMIARGELRYLLDGQAASSFSVYAAYVSKKQLSPKIRTFIDVLVEHRADFTDTISDAEA